VTGFIAAREASFIATEPTRRKHTSYGTRHGRVIHGTNPEEQAHVLWHTSRMTLGRVIHGTNPGEQAHVLWRTSRMTLGRVIHGTKTPCILFFRTGVNGEFCASVQNCPFHPGFSGFVRFV